MSEFEMITRANGTRVWYLNGQQVDPGTVLLLEFVNGLSLDQKPRCGTV